MKMQFSKTAIEALQPQPAKRYWCSDTKVRGLQIAVHPSGRKQFYLYRKVASRPERISLGPYPDMSVEVARRQAEQMNAAIAEGRNPAEDRRTASKQETFEELFALYMERHAKPRKRSWKGDESLWRVYLHRLGKRRLDDLGRRHFATLHAEISKTNPVVANRVLSLASGIFGRALEWGIWEGTNPCKGIRANREMPRARYLRGTELRRFLVALNDEPCDTTHDVLYTSLLTGARQANVLQMCWSEIDFEEKEWMIPGPKFKTGKPQTIPLRPEVVAILRRRRETTQSSWVFPALRADSESGFFTGISAAWKRVVLRTEAIGLAELISERTQESFDAVKERIWLQTQVSRSKHAMKRSRLSATDDVMEALRAEVTALGLDPGMAHVVDLRMHDLRRTFASWQVKMGASLYLTGRSLGQTDVKTTMGYAYLDKETVRSSMETAGAAILAVGQPQPPRLSFVSSKHTPS